ncbi:MAG: prolipoprotein diacylglyceryl transferase [Leptolyngbyaceae cyanobacterium SU_3_3]|nr:prolipoprotein diacylglyceryl transferase [Leptolyngbyaceae cyanobacterium SU_3_3]NJR48473.1 prolipoprotein diacylglyceryl transferase [Leptolyngbyaceae cyanobacterium CSU_1_3]
MSFPVYIWGLHPHFLFEAIAYSVALRLSLRNFQQDIIPATQRSSIVVGGLVGALVGAKLLVILQHLDLFWQQQEQFWLLLLQGKTVVGALLGAVAGVELTKKLLGVQRSTGDVFVYPLILGTAIGRIGCFLTGLSDRTYGVSTVLPWGVDFGDGILRHPTQIYEIAFLIALLIFLKWRSRYPYQSGDLFKFYMIAYLSFRFLIDFIKPDFRPILALSAIQIACLLAIVYYRSSIPALLPKAN